MNNPNPNNQNEDNEGGQQHQGGQQGGQQQQGGQTSPASKVASSRAGRTSLVSKVVSNANSKIKGPANTGPFLMCGVHLDRLGGFRFHVDDAFRDLS